MSNRLFQGVLQQMHEITNCELGVIDCNALIIACSDPSKVGCTNELINLDLSDTNDCLSATATHTCPLVLASPRANTSSLRRAPMTQPTNMHPCSASP